jgi:hypothetical protein
VGYCPSVDAWVWIVVAILLFVLLLGVLGRRAARGRVDPTDLLLEPELVEEVRALARGGHKAAAIALLRKRTSGLGLAPATLMVERMAAKPAPPTRGPSGTDSVDGR